MFYLFLAILGLVAGSFLGMLTFRIPRKQQLSGRSFCDNCKKNITWYQNIPVFYYLFFGGKCGICGKKIHWRYPVIEAATTIAFVSTGYLWLHPSGGSINPVLGVFGLPFFLLLVTCCLLLIITDLEFKILPDEILVPLAILTFLFLLFAPSPTLFTHLFWGFVVFLFFLAIYLLTRGRGMGFGDVKLVFILGSLLGYPASLVWVFLSFLTGAASGLILILLGKAKRDSPIAFGPYLVFSFWVALFFGKTIYEWYLNF